MENRNIAPEYRPGVDIPPENAPEIWDFLVTRGRENLKNTAFVTGERFTEKDIDALKKYYQEALDHQEGKFGEDGAVFNRSLLEHYSLAERLAEKIAPLIGVDSFLLRAVVLTHDFGRTFSHRRGRNNVIGDSLMKKIGFSDSFTKLLPPDTLWTEIDKASLNERLTKATTENGGLIGATELIDVLAKWKNKNEGQLRKWEDVIESSRAGQKKPNLENMWPSELKRQTKTTSEEGNKAIETKYTFLKEWFEKRSGRKIDDFMGEVENTIRSKPLKENWV